MNSLSSKIPEPSSFPPDNQLFGSTVSHRRNAVSTDTVGVLGCLNFVNVVLAVSSQYRGMHLTIQFLQHFS